MLALALVAGFVAGASESAVKTSPTADIAHAATVFLASLDDDARAKARLAFDSEERFNWHFVPKPRAGLPLKAMSAPQRSAALELLRVGLSEKGYTKAEAIRGLEVILAELEQDPVRRDPDLYYVTIFGEPLADGTWGWRFEGHHISLNWTFVRDDQSRRRRNSSAATRMVTETTRAAACACCGPNRTSRVRCSKASRKRSVHRR